MKIDIMNLLKEALKTNKLKDLLEGNGDYNIPNQSGFITDKDIVLYGGIYEYYKKYPQSGIDLIYEKTLTQMLNESLFDVLNSMDYAFMQIMSESINIAPFQLSNDFYIKLRNTIKQNAEKLKQYKEYVQYGAKLQNGAYDYIENLNKFCEDNYGQHIL